MRSRGFGDSASRYARVCAKEACFSTGPKNTMIGDVPRKAVLKHAPACADLSACGPACAKRSAAGRNAQAVASAGRRSKRARAFDRARRGEAFRILPPIRGIRVIRGLETGREPTTDHMDHTDEGVSGDWSWLGRRRSGLNLFGSSVCGGECGILEPQLGFLITGNETQNSELGFKDSTALPPRPSMFCARDEVVVQDDLVGCWFIAGASDVEGDEALSNQGVCECLLRNDFFGHQTEHPEPQTLTDS